MPRGHDPNRYITLGGNVTRTWDHHAERLPSSDVISVDGCVVYIGLSEAAADAKWAEWTSQPEWQGTLRERQTHSRRTTGSRTPAPCVSWCSKCPHRARIPTLEPLGHLEGIAGLLQRYIDVCLQRAGLSNTGDGGRALRFWPLLDPGVTTKSLVSLGYVRKSRFVFCSRLGLGGHGRPVRLSRKAWGYMKGVRLAPSLPPEEGAVEIRGVRAGSGRHYENPQHFRGFLEKVRRCHFVGFNQQGAQVDACLCL